MRTAQRAARPKTQQQAEPGGRDDLPGFAFLFAVEWLSPITYTSIVSKKSDNATKPHRNRAVTLIPGDGVGPEVSAPRR